MKTGPDAGALLLYCIGAIVFFLTLQRVLLIVKAWCVRRWRVTSGVVKDTMLVPHAELVPWGRYRRNNTFVAVSQYVAVVNYTFHDGGIDREGRLLQRILSAKACLIDSQTPTFRYRESN
jgi:hypothetical protein